MEENAFSVYTDNLRLDCPFSNHSNWFKQVQPKILRGNNKKPHIAMITFLSRFNLAVVQYDRENRKTINREKNKARGLNVNKTVLNISKSLSLSLSLSQRNIKRPATSNTQGKLHFLNTLFKSINSWYLAKSNNIYGIYSS